MPTKKIVKTVGLDYSQKDLFVSSDLEYGNYPKFYREAQIKLAKEQRNLSRKKHGSNRYLKQKLKVAKIHETITNRRKDFLHKLSRQMADRYDCVFIEDLNMQLLSQRLNLARNLLDNGWGIFTTFINYKLNDSGGLLHKINKWTPSSKTCSVCGLINNNLKLSDREWICECGVKHSRDINASINIKTVGATELARICLSQ